MAAIRTSKQKMHNTIWLVCGLLCLCLALVAWAITDKDQLELVETAAATDVAVQIQPEKVAATTHLGGLLEEVRPLEMTTRVVATGTHEAEFRGNKFIEDNKKKYVIELFRVSEEQIINTFLKKQELRKDYHYIRLSGENQAEQYVLLYGLYHNENEAKNALSTLNLALPKSVQPHVEQMSTYKDFVNDMGSDELGLNQKLYAVKLRPVAVPVVDETVLAEAKRRALIQQQNLAAKPNASNINKNNSNTTQKPQSNSTPSTAPARATPAQEAPVITPDKASTSTTVVRRDQHGNVVDVQQSHSQSNNNN
jgi:hypothetical protein